MKIKHRILIVDDEESVLRILQNSLRKEKDKYDVFTATDGFTALQLMQQTPFDLVVTDYRMPDMDGLELMNAIYADYPETRVILVTAYGSDALQEEAAQLNAYRYLLKPLDINTFRSVVRESLMVDESQSARKGLLVLSNQRYQEITVMLEQMLGDIGARCAILTDTNGQIITNTGDIGGFPVEEIASLLSGSMATLQAAGEALDGEQNTINLSYREGDRDNLYAINIGRQLLLVAIIENSPYNSRLGTAWYYARKTAVALRDLLNKTESGVPALTLDNNIDESLDDAFDSLFSADL
jgi:CheY-like chemotaxis protein